jgi:hypothetical protein
MTCGYRPPFTCEAACAALNADRMEGLKLPAKLTCSAPGVFATPEAALAADVRICTTNANSGMSTAEAIHEAGPALARRRTVSGRTNFEGGAPREHPAGVGCSGTDGGGAVIDISRAQVGGA